MASFVKWYTTVLKSHPFVANMGTAVVLMSAGDAMAQGIEHNRPPHNVTDTEDNITSPAKVTLEGGQPLAVSAAVDRETPTCTSSLRSFALNRHATLSPHLEVAHCDYGITRLEWENPTAAGVLDAATPDSWQGLPLDGVRTSFMALWAGAVQAPFFLMLYRFYDRILPTAVTPYAVGSRVALSFVTTIPFTAAFFGYGTLVHHLLHTDHKETCRQVEMSDDGMEQQENALFWTTVADQIQEKWTNDLGSTLQTSATVWVPFNTVNFSLIPPHLRPLSMCAMSALWNCYLSLVQHKD
eukprot:scaffold291_cov168-Amphora_coffeaeformis.AAC.12